MSFIKIKQGPGMLQRQKCRALNEKQTPLPFNKLNKNTFSCPWPCEEILRVMIRHLSTPGNWFITLVGCCKQFISLTWQLFPHAGANMPELFGLEWNHPFCNYCVVLIKMATGWTLHSHGDPTYPHSTLQVN